MKMMFGFYDGCMDSGSMDDMSIWKCRENG
jgi:hypothetical protein